MIDVHCSNCSQKIGEYAGNIGPTIPIQSRHYKRTDGTQPVHGSSTAWPCPHCKQTINELVCVMNACVKNMQPDPQVLAELIGRADPKGPTP